MIKLLALCVSFLSIYGFSNQKTVKRNNLNSLHMNSNILLENSGLPLFSQFKNEQIEPGIKKILSDLETDFNKLEKDVEKETDIKKLYNLVIEQSEKIEYPLSFGWGLVSHLYSVKNNDELRKQHDLMQPEVIKLSTKLSQSEIMYNALKKLDESDIFNDIQKRIISSSVHGMTLSGIGLKGEKKERFNQIKLRLGELSTKFSSNVLDSTKEYELYITEKNDDILKLPESALELYSQSAKDKYPESTPDNGPWKITLDIPSYLPIMLHHPSSKFREELYKEYIKRASEDKFNNEPIIKEILALKKEMANLLGFKNYVELSLSKKMASTQDEIEELLNMLGEKSLPHYKRDLQKVISHASNADSCIDQLYLWDIPYWSERQKEIELDFKEEELKPYFPFRSVLEGLFNLAGNLFDIRIEEIDTDKENIDVWDKDVSYYKIYNATTNEEVASFFLDPFSRPSEKRSGAWMNSCLDRNDFLGKKPVAYLICNGAPPLKDASGKITKPSLMTFREVETLFHEFGHGLQHMLTKVGDASASGINNIEWDAVELPSQFMENWCYHKPTVTSFAKHYQTGEKIPDELFDKISKQRTFMTGGGICRQVYFSMLDLYLHSHYKEEENLFEVQKNIASKYMVKPILDSDRFLCSFGHIFAGGYAAGYYSYKWAEVMSADAFSAFEEINLDDPKEIAELGKKFRDTVLAKGGGEHPSQVFKDFRGREPKPDALLKHNGITNLYEVDGM